MKSRRASFRLRLKIDQQQLLRSKAKRRRFKSETEQSGVFIANTKKTAGVSQLFNFNWSLVVRHCPSLVEIKYNFLIFA